MTYVHDTRDKPGKHDNVEKGLEAMGHKLLRSKLFVGDVAKLTDLSVCIDLKQGLSEVESNLVHQHKRFRDECLRAQENGITLIILIEDERIATVSDVPSWVNPRRWKYEQDKRMQSAGARQIKPLPTRPPINGKQLYGMMATMSQRYGVQWAFTKRANAAQRIVELLGGE